MNLRTALAKEHSKKQAIQIAVYIGDDKKLFVQLMDIFLGTDSVLAQRSAYSFGFIVEKHPELITSYYDQLIAIIQDDTKHNALARNILRAFSHIKIPIQYHDRLINICFDLLIDREKAIAIKAFGMSVLYKLIRDIPELKNEMGLILERDFEFESKAYQSRARRILKLIG